MKHVVVAKVALAVKDVPNHVHAVDCPDLHKGRKYVESEHWTIEVENKLDVIAAVYDPGNFDYDLDDAASRAPYEQDIKFLPCALAVLEVAAPVEKPKLTPAPAKTTKWSSKPETRKEIDLDRAQRAVIRQHAKIEQLKQQLADAERQLSTLVDERERRHQLVPTAQVSSTGEVRFDRTEKGASK